jgi:hypothetical protein
MSPDMKSIIMSELQKPELDLAIFHAHAVNTTPIPARIPVRRQINENIEARENSSCVEKCEKPGIAKSRLKKLKKYYQSEYNLPDSWFENALDDSVEQADSLYSASLDLYSSDGRSNCSAGRNRSIR